MKLDLHYDSFDDRKDYETLIEYSLVYTRIFPSFQQARVLLPEATLSVLPMCSLSLDKAANASWWQVKKTSASPFSLPLELHSSTIFDTTRGEKNCREKEITHRHTDTHTVKASHLECSNATSSELVIISLLFFYLNDIFSAHIEGKSSHVDVVEHGGRPLGRS